MKQPEYRNEEARRRGTRKYKERRGGRTGGIQERGGEETRIEEIQRYCQRCEVPEQAEGLVEGRCVRCAAAVKRKRSRFGKMEKTLKALCETLAGFAVSAVK